MRAANDANCFALSEAVDGAARGADVVFGVILGTGVGGGLCVGGRVLSGAHAIAGEWGHNPLPAPHADELPGPECYCGKRGCIETWCSGPALDGAIPSADRQKAERRRNRRCSEPATLVRGRPDAYLDRLARALAGVVNMLDPDVIVLGGGLSNIDALYDELPARVEAHAFDAGRTASRIVKNLHGDSSGVRGAAWLWPQRPRLPQ